MESIRLAIQLEFKGHEFYNRLAQEATSDFEKKQGPQENRHC